LFDVHVGDVASSIPIFFSLIVYPIMDRAAFAWAYALVDVQLRDFSSVEASSITLP
jgi:hypothetical protein